MFNWCQRPVAEKLRKLSCPANFGEIFEILPDASQVEPGGSSQSAVLSEVAPEHWRAEPMATPKRKSSSAADVSCSPTVSTTDRCSGQARNSVSSDSAVIAERLSTPLSPWSPPSPMRFACAPAEASEPSDSGEGCSDTSKNRVPPLDLHLLTGARRKWHRARQMLALDVANLLSNSTFSVVQTSRALVEFRPLKDGFADAQTAPQRVRRKRNSMFAEVGDTRRTEAAVVGPGFALLPQSKSSCFSSSESVPLYRRSTFYAIDSGEAEDSLQSTKPRDSTLDERHLAGMFKTKRLTRRPTAAASKGHFKTPSAECHEELDPAELEVIRADLTRFTEALEDRSMVKLIDLLECRTRVPAELAVVRQAHPWVSLPESIQSLAANQLSLMVAGNAELSAELAETATRRLVPMLREQSRPDLPEAALLALSFLTIKLPALSQLIYENDALGVLIQLMHNDKEGVKAAAAQLCRNIYVLHLNHKQKFRDLGGIHGLLTMLQPQRSADLQLECLYHIEDLILQNGEEIPEFIENVKVLSLSGVLEKLLDSANAALAGAAKQLYLRIAD